MNCHYCGAELAEGVVFCGNCGTRRAKIQEETPEIITEKEAEQVFPVIEVPAPVGEKSQRPAYVPYGAPERTVATRTPAIQLPVKRGLCKMIFLGILTLGIYPLVIWCRIVTELNIVASRYDGERTMSYLGSALLGPITLFVYPLIWIHDFCRRIGAELKRRCIAYDFSAASFWLWNVLGCLILVGPFIFTYKLMKAMNLLNADYNVNG